MVPFEYPFSAVTFAALAAFVLGMFWYHPKVMGTKWLEARGKVGEEVTKPTGIQMGVSLILWLIAACFYAFLVGLLDVSGFPGLICLASLLWVAFAMPPVLMGSLYTGYPFQAVAIDSAFQLSGYFLFAVVFALVHSF
jgi:hypothetical protein